MQIAAETETLDQPLPDGSVAFINKNSTLSYVYSPLKKQRKVKLTGEAFFDIKHEEEQPFIIETDDVFIEDIGTTFNVKAYPDSITVEVFVETGEVAFYTNDNPGIRLTEGQTGIYNRATKTFAKFLESDTNKLAYKTGIFTFHDTDLEAVIVSLNKVYDKKLSLKNDALKTCRLNVSFRNESIEDIVEILAETLGLTITNTENEIILDGKGCSE
jgi:ferric-dicitrate binding protein FerR (iron transport regulator)